VLEFLNNLRGARNLVGILSYRPGDSLATQPCRIGSLESILGLLKSLKIRALLKDWYSYFTRPLTPRLKIPRLRYRENLHKIKYTPATFSSIFNDWLNLFDKLGARRMISGGLKASLDFGSPGIRRNI
jgi:hypothetical protein